MKLNKITMVYYFDNKSRKSSLPVPPKKEYGGLCEVADEFKANENFLIDELMKTVNVNMKEYRGYAKADHSDIGPHFHSFGSIDMNGGYMGHIGIDWPSTGAGPSCCITKDFQLKDACNGMTAGYIFPEYGEGRILAFFTDWLLEGLGDSTRTGKDLLFLDCAHTGIVSYCNDEARWLFCNGIAYGHKLCKFTVFTEFSDRFRFPSWVLSEDDLDELHEDIWNEMN